MFLRDERGGTVEWILCIIAGALMAAAAYKYIGPGVRSASQSLGNALQGS